MSENSYYLHETYYCKACDTPVYFGHKCLVCPECGGPIERIERHKKIKRSGPIFNESIEKACEFILFLWISDTNQVCGSCKDMNKCKQLLMEAKL